MSKHKSKRGRLKRAVDLAEKHGATAPQLHELDLRINVLCSQQKLAPDEAHEMRDRLRKVTVRPKKENNWLGKTVAKPKAPKVPMRPDGLGPERRQHDRMEEEHGTTVAGVLLYTSMRRKERGFSEIRPRRKAGSRRS